MWIIQTVGMRQAADNADELVTALIEKNIPYVTVGLIPFTSEISGLDQIDFNNTQTPINIYGSCKFIRLCTEQVPQIKNRVFFDYSSFNHFAYSRECRDNLLNNINVKGVVCSIDELLKKWYPRKLKYPRFVRPMMDLKPFAGSLVPKGTLLDDWFVDRFGTKDYNKHQMVYAGLPINILAEYRFFIVNRKIVTGCRYRLNGDLKSAKGVPSAARKLVKQQIKEWLPHDNCVVDVCSIDGNFEKVEYKIIEFNCINCSGFYACDVGAVVDALEEYK